MAAPGMVPDPLDGFLGRIEEFVVANPELAGALAIVTVLVLVGAAFLYRWFTRSPGERLARVLGKADEVAILMHPNPDPDAMGAAIGVRELAEARGTTGSIYYAGQIRHQENRAFQTVLDLDFDRAEAAEDIEEDTLVLVDHNRPRGFTGTERLEPDVVVDHHPGDGTGTSFTDVRPDYGACSSIVAEYFESLSAEPGVRTNGRSRTDGGTTDRPNTPELRPSIATGMMYGIQADTDHLTKGCTPSEFAASSYLYSAADEELLHRIANPRMTAEVLETKAKAINERVINGSFAIADVGELSDLDAIPQAAEELIRLEGISAVVVYGSKDETIHLSGRSIDDRVHMGNILEAVFESVPMASAGGHARMGGGQVPISYLAGIGPKGVDADRARSDLRGRLFDALKGNV